MNDVPDWLVDLVQETRRLLGVGMVGQIRPLGKGDIGDKTTPPADLGSPQE